MNVYQLSLLEMFKDIISFLEKHKLKYVAAYGTVLGAARHHGFIPWDDDIDIYMWREDYEKLLKLKDELIKDHYDVTSINDDGYYLPFAKIIDTNTTLWEIEKIPYIIGNFIDVFPLDRYQCCDEEMYAIQKKSRAIFFDYQSTVTNENLLDALKYFFTGHKTSMIRAMRHAFYGSSRKNDKLKRFKDFEKKYAYGKGDKCVCVNMPEGQFLKAKWFEETIRVPFEDTTIVIPKDYNEFLTCMYGNWQTPPPPQKQLGKHENVKYYFNLNERLTIAEVRERIKKGEKLVI